MEARAQADAWISATAASNGNGNWTNLIGVPGTAALPVPGGPNGYNGQVPRYSHHIRTNGSGSIIFFAVDGNLYDGDGYLIADARGTNCQECLAPGVLEFISLPMPGQCGVYYLFSSVPRSLTYDGSHVQVSILDMNEPNPRFQQADVCNSYRGRLIGLHDFEVQQRYPSLSAWELGVDYLLDPTAPLSMVVAQLPINPTGKSQSPMLRIVQGAGPNDPSFLFAIMTTKTFVYRLTNVGVDLISPVAGLDHFPTYSTNDPFTSKQFYRDADARRTANGEIRLVMTSGPGLQTYPFQLPIPPNHNMLAARFNGTTGTLVPGSVQGWLIDPLPNPCGGPGGNSAGGLAGCALDPSANGAWYLAENTTDCNSWQPKLAHIEFATGTITDASAQVPGLQAYVRSRMYRNSGPSNTEDIHIPHAGGVAAFQNTAVPGTVTLTPSAFSGAFPPLHADPPGEASNNYQPRFLNTAVQGDTHLSIDNIAQCCTYFQTVPSAVVGGHIQLPGMSPVSWNGASNPLQPGSSTLVFNCDLVVESGAVLILNNLTAKFTDDAKVIVKRGGTLQLYNSTATSLSCPNERWPGIRVEGTTANGFQGVSQVVGGQTQYIQGYLRLENSTVENAVVGAWTTREAANGTAVPGHTGGRIFGINATFRNCISGARIDPYMRTSSTGAALNNLSRFDDCQFITDQDWPDFGVNTPLHHARLLSVRGVRFNQCKFRNDIPDQFPQLARGWGIQGLAGFDVLGSTGTDASLFSGLTVGVFAATSTTHKANVRQSWFRNNFVGAYFLGSTAPELSRSQFFVPTGIWPNPAMGLLLQQSTAYLVEENTFTGLPGSNGNVGIYWKGNVLTDNRVYNNSFSQLFVGTYVQDRHKGNTPTTEAKGLQVLCGDYTGCVFDYYLGDNTRIREDQGFWNGGGNPQNQLAGNRFYNGAVNGILISSVQPLPLAPDFIPAPYFDYKRHNVPECDPINPSPFYSDYFIPEATSFIKAEACGNGWLPAIGGGGGVVGFGLAAAQLQSAQANLNGTVDTGEREDILEAIKRSTPWLPSHTLRDYLLARTPLSDRVLLTMLYREMPMDPSHLTQVLLANARLTEQVRMAVRETDLLNEYMLAIVLNAGSGSTVKDLLMQEVVMRGDEKARYLAIALDEWATDTITPDPADSVLAMLAAHPDPSDYYLLAELEMERGDYMAATDWLDAAVAAKAEDAGLLRELVALHQTLDGDWCQANAAQRATLATMAGSIEPGSGFALNILYLLNETYEMPRAEEPSNEKSLRWTPAWRTTATERPVLEAHPNPSNGQSWAVISVDLENGALLRVSDPQGRLVRTIRLAAGQRLAELDLMGLANGLYTCELIQGEYKLGATKLTVQR